MYRYNYYLCIMIGGNDHATITDQLL